MSFADFLDNITDPDRVCMLIDDLFTCTRDFAEEMIDLCESEGMEVLKAAPAAIAELGEILAPLQQRHFSRERERGSHPPGAAKPLKPC